MMVPVGLVQVTMPASGSHQRLLGGLDLRGRSARVGARAAPAATTRP
jgi:hypothetical protein